MSARGRKRADGGVTEVAEHEFYPTPAPAIDAMITSRIVTLPGGRWLDPCAGAGAIPNVTNGHRSDIAWDLVDIDYRHVSALRMVDRVTSITTADFLALALDPALDGRLWDVAIFNPPFSRALEFVVHCRRLASVTVMLQRLNWIGPARAAWLRANQPDVYALPKRPSFTGDGNTDAAEYAWFVWDERAPSQRFGRVAMLDEARSNT